MPRMLRCNGLRIKEQEGRVGMKKGVSEVRQTAKWKEPGRGPESRHTASGKECSAN